MVPSAHAVPQFTPEQEQVLSSWGKGMAVLAGAGSGKTTTLVGKCVKLLEQNADSRFAAVSFTERSAGDLKVKLSQALLERFGPGSMSSHWVMTIHGLCATILKEFPREAGFDGEESVMSEAESQGLWKRSLDGLWYDELPEEVELSWNQLLDRETQESLYQLLKRVKDLSSLGMLDRLEESLDRTTLSLRCVAIHVIEKYEKLKHRRGVIDFHDLEKGALRALRIARVRESYHRRFNLILIDEFQDTNPLQAEIISLFAKRDYSNLCVVGDPKQSIYRFRDADVGVFEKFCNELPLQFSLTSNFRSLPGIINFVNQTCEKVFHASQLEFESLVAKRCQNAEDMPVIRLDVSDPLILGNWILKEVDNGIPLHEMALLVRKIRGNERWLKGLSASGIPLAVGSGGLFWEEPRIRELVSFLKWWDNPGSNLSGAIFLRAPWTGISDLEIDRWSKVDVNLWSPFFESDNKLAIALKPYVNRILRPGELLMLLLVDDEIEDELGAPLLSLWHRVEELTSKGAGFHAVVLELSRALQENRREREMPAPRELGQLPVLTFHGAKGLEFSHVILIDFSSRNRFPDAPLLFWDRQEGAFLGSRDSSGDRERNRTDENVWRELEKTKNLEESKRLFYVALTRAMNRLILVCPPLELALNEDEAKKTLKQDYWRAWVEYSPYHVPFMDVSGPNKNNGIKTISPLDGQKCISKKVLNRSKTDENNSSVDRFHKDNTERNSNSKQNSMPVFMRARHSVTEWTLLSKCPRAYEWSYIRSSDHEVKVEPNLSDPSNLVENDIWQMKQIVDYSENLLSKEVEEKSESSIEHQKSQQRNWLETEISYQELGTRVHQCLESLDYQGLKMLEDEVGKHQFHAQPIIEWARSTTYMQPADLAVGRDVWTELAFETPFQGEILVGSIDRVILEIAQGKKHYTLIDFKLTETAKTAAQLRDSYQTQLDLYAWALTSLDSGLEFDQITALIINICSQTIQTIPIALTRKQPQRWVNESTLIINGLAGNPRPGSLCKYCSFLSSCHEGRRSLLKE